MATIHAWLDTSTPPKINYTAYVWWDLLNKYWHIAGSDSDSYSSSYNIALEHAQYFGDDPKNIVIIHIPGGKVVNA